MKNIQDSRDPESGDVTNLVVRCLYRSLHKPLETAKTIHNILVDYTYVRKFAILLD
jgi:hypothetical protein